MKKSSVASACSRAYKRVRAPITVNVAIAKEHVVCACASARQLKNAAGRKEEANANPPPGQKKRRCAITTSMTQRRACRAVISIRRRVHSPRTTRWNGKGVIVMRLVGYVYTAQHAAGQTQKVVVTNNEKALRRGNKAKEEHRRSTYLPQ